MGSVPSRTFQSNDIIVCGRTFSSENADVKKPKKKFIVPYIHIETPSRRRRAAFIKDEKATNNIDKNKLWIHWAPRRYSWPNTVIIKNRKGGEFPKDS